MMKIFISILFITVFISCSKQESCYCDAGDGEYSYLPTSTNVQSSGSVNASGDIEQECNLQDAYLKATMGLGSYCEMK